jgi:hypothetical protein
LCGVGVEIQLLKHTMEDKFVFLRRHGLVTLMRAHSPAVTTSSLTYMAVPLFFVRAGGLYGVV